MIEFLLTCIVVLIVWCILLTRSQLKLVESIENLQMEVAVIEAEAKQSSKPESNGEKEMVQSLFNKLGEYSRFGNRK